MYPSRDDLLSTMTLAEPLGPIAHERIGNDVIDALVYHQIALFSEVQTKPHMLFLGRKGAGKSALLTEIRLGTTKKGRRGLYLRDDEPRKNRDYVIDVFSWEHFHQIVRNVNRLFRTDDVIDELIPAEYFVELWYQTLWDEIIHYFYNYFPYDDECRRLLKAVDKYVNVDGDFQGTVQQRAKTVFNAAKSSIVEFLNKKNSRLYFLFDSMDNYPVRNITFVKIISGLFQGLTKISDESPRIIVSFCIPEEIESFVTAASSNLMKDLASSYRIRWRPVDLIRIVAHRLRVSSSIHDRTLFAQIADLDFTKRDDLHKLYDLVLPERVRNSQGTDEDPLAYIIRHTQVLPRHILAIFNSALSYHYKSTKSFTKLSEEAIRKGVSATQQLIARHILIPFEQLYPKLLARCNSVLPDLDPICDYNTLKRAEGRFDRVIEDDVGSVWQALFEMGVIGRSSNHTGTDSHKLSANERYCYGQFHFNIDGASFGLATDGEYCFHPVFTRKFGMIRRTQDKRVVYPAHIDLANIYAEA
jgi:hypothetical protein